MLQTREDMAPLRYSDGFIELTFRQVQHLTILHAGGWGNCDCTQKRGANLIADTILGVGRRLVALQVRAVQHALQHLHMPGHKPIHTQPTFLTTLNQRRHASAAAPHPSRAASSYRAGATAAAQPRRDPVRCSKFDKCWHACGCTVTLLASHPVT